MKIQSYLAGEWCSGDGRTDTLVNSVNDAFIGEVSSLTSGFDQFLNYGRTVAGPALRRLTIHERAERIKFLAKYLLDRKEEFYRISSMTGATRADSWVDIEGGIGTMFSYSGIARRELNNDTFVVEGNVEPLSQQGTFVGQHILTSKEGVAVHINAFNFPVWGMLEKIAPSLIAGVPVIVKPATVTCYLTEAVVKAIVESKILPEGSVQLICGSVGDTFDHLTEQDIVTFTGSASTGQMLRVHPNIIAKSVPFTMEADSLNCCILAPDVSVEDPEFDLYIKEVAREMTTKAGQKCTAIRRAIVPQDKVDAVTEALIKRLTGTVIGDPTQEGVRMGALVGKSQREDVLAAVEQLKQSSEVVLNGLDNFQCVGVEGDKGAFMAPTLLHCKEPLVKTTSHEVEAFGPVSTLMPYQNLEDAIQLAKMGKGSLAGSVFTASRENARDIILGTASHHGRMLVIDRNCAKESTGHGSPLASLVHGGPGRAGGGEELGGSRAIKHYMQRTAIQGSPTSLMAVTNQYVRGADVKRDRVHPFRKYFEELEIGESLTTHRRTVTEADIVNFGCLSGDHFYAHFDEIAAKDSFFEKRVAHGYFVISAAAGMFVDPGQGPVIANYGIDNLRFVEPVGIGDTIQVKLSVKRKIKKSKKPDDKYVTGVVVWDVEVVNQNDEPVAIYDILTLVERQNED
ncbi:phenylacetic acid degradation bifunctional protein PaaZ [Aliikangiella coralliicola]|uniref:Phenylacetic acid degradation bifunctional protein PaaZ n=1 Tax=Aliikangiella coralliicola TaxID=2592383 RepID=A0A545U515_9GAMM|nr:phenylacetic acid degradation bifunctional protein PaaZ [Aliikangiella coralliicola]TQV84570.1 phenylacetic acid degradation bifunctional protein PaaZ [Aliikangiella coralliicola]